MGQYILIHLFFAVHVILIDTTINDFCCFISFLFTFNAVVLVLFPYSAVNLINSFHYWQINLLSLLLLLPLYVVSTQWRFEMSAGRERVDSCLMLLSLSLCVSCKCLRKNEKLFFNVCWNVNIKLNREIEKKEKIIFFFAFLSWCLCKYFRFLSFMITNTYSNKHVCIHTWSRWRKNIYFPYTVGEWLLSSL